MSEIQKVLDQRASRYGDFKDNAVLSQELSQVVKKHIALAGKTNFPEYQLEAITIIMQKVSRIIYGDHDYDDNYVDIAGYATRVANYLKKGPSIYDADIGKTVKAIKDLPGISFKKPPPLILRSELQSDNELYNNIIEAVQDLNKTRSELYTEVNKNIKQDTLTSTKDSEPLSTRPRKIIFGTIPQ